MLQETSLMISQHPLSDGTEPLRETMLTKLYDVL